MTITTNITIIAILNLSIIVVIIIIIGGQVFNTSAGPLSLDDNETRKLNLPSLAS